MKKLLVALVVAALTCLSSMAFAADVAVSGSIDIRGRNYVNTDLDKSVSDNKNDTQERVRVNIDAKAGDAVSGRISIENDWDTWGRFEAPMGAAEPRTKTTGGLDLREAWINFKMPGTPVGVKGGHMLLQLGNGWFFRDMKYGSDAWVVYTDIDALHLGVVNIKVGENVVANADDTDAFAFVAAYKLSDKASIGINFTNVNDRAGKTFDALYAVPAGAVQNASLQNAELTFSGMLGPVNLKADIDVQMGDAKIVNGVTGVYDKHKFEGNQIVLQATIPMDALTINATAARGSGANTTSVTPDTNFKEYIALMDGDIHYTLIYEYLVPTAAGQSFTSLHTGFGNTTAASLGLGINATKNLMIGVDAWYLQATEAVGTYTDVLGNLVTSKDLGYEVDAKINWKLYENLSWNTMLGYFAPGKAYQTLDPVTLGGKDATVAEAIQSVLSFKF
jgi:hypothetical protein